MSLSKITPVVIDTDPGIDDTYAIISLLQSEEKFNIKVQGITTVNGNTSVEHGTQNTLLILKTLNRLDVPVFIGAESSLLHKQQFYTKHHGVDGFGDFYKDKPSLDLVQKKHAVEALREMIEENPNEIVVFAVGPLTNIALLYKLYPEISVKIKQLWIMGGNVFGIGNVTKAAEFNFWSDPEAAHIVLNETKCPVYIYPWEACTKASEKMPLKEWRQEILSSNSNPITNLLDPAEGNLPNIWRFIPCDAYAVCCFLMPQMIKSMEECHVSIELDGKNTRGQMVIDHKKTEKPNAFVIYDIDAELFKKFLLWICGHENSGFDL